MNNKLVFTIVLGLLCTFGYSQTGYKWWYRDADNDQYGISSDKVWASYPPAGYTWRDGDCNDDPFYGPSINPGATEVCDGKDNNCDGIIDNVVNATPTKYNLTAGSSSVCANTTTTITLSDSQSGVSYQLYKGTATYGNPKNGTGNALTWNNIVAGTYKIIATGGASCGTTPSTEMNNQVVIGTTTADPIGISPSTGTLVNICPGQVQLFPANTNSVQNWTGVDSWT
ncbi:MAG: putative metal-binding motif-containing protein, partial [Flavobacteriaceae bacterium]